MTNAQDTSRELLKSLNNKVVPYDERKDIMIEFRQKFLESVSSIADVKVRFRMLRAAFKNHPEIKQRLESYNYQTYDSAVEYVLQRYGDSRTSWTAMVRKLDLLPDSCKSIHDEIRLHDRAFWFFTRVRLFPQLFSHKLTE